MGLFGRKRSPPPEERGRAPVAVVTGVGPVSAVGCGRNAFFDGLLAGRAGYGPITACDVSRSPSKVGAEVRGFRIADYVQHGRVLARWAPRTTQLALASAVLALHDAEIELDAVDPDRLGLAVGSGVGNVDAVMESSARWRAGGELAPHTAFVCVHHSVACVLSSFFNVRGTTTTISTGCNSGIDALGQALRSIQAGAADAILVVGSDSELVPEVMAALNASGSLSARYNAEPERASRPFDAGRDGNVIGEGAAALLLESEAHALARGARVYARLVGYHMAAAGGGRRYSHDRPDLDHEPATRALRGALREAGWRAAEVELVNANGSSSVLYDPLEARALAEVLGARFPEVPVHSIKSMLGQHGAGSSALQCASACLTLRRAVAAPTINLERLDPACGPLNVLTEPTHCAPRRVLVHSIGLGGFYYSAAAFERPGFDGRANVTGAATVGWSRGHHPRHAPAPEFQAPLEPWSPRGELDLERPDELPL